MLWVIFARTFLVRFEAFRRGCGCYLWWYKLLKDRLTKLVGNTAQGTKAVTVRRRRAELFGGLSMDSVFEAGASWLPLLRVA
jgi:hypothetical protein